MSRICKVPVLLQLDALECGAAALCMVLAFHGKWLSLERVRADCGVSRDGSSAKNIMYAARLYGMSAYVKSVAPEGLRDIPLPAVLDWNLGHFVVLNGFKKNKAVINDPARGRIEITAEELRESFAGNAIILEKTDDFVPEGRPRSIFVFAVRRMGGSSRAVTFVLLTSFLVSIIGAFAPFFSKVFMDNILSGTNPEWLTPFIAAMGVTAALQFALAALRCTQMMRINGRFAITANADFIWHVLNLPMEFFAQRWSGDLASRQWSNESFSREIMNILAPIVVNAVFLVLYVYVMIRYSLALTLIGVFTALFNLFFARVYARKMMNNSRRAQACEGKLQSMTVAAVDMMESIKAVGAENGMFERWAGYFARHHNAAASRTNGYLDALAPAMCRLANIAVLMSGAYLILTGSFTIGTLLAFQGLLSSFLTPVNQISSAVKDFTQMRVTMERIEDVMNYKTEEIPAAKAGAVLGKLDGSLELKNVTFGYSKTSTPDIRDFSLTLAPGATAAIVGGSGSGKSTVAKLICGLYKPWSGEILIDGKRLSEIDGNTFRSSVAMVDQEIVLFEDTVADNIRMWDDSIEDFAVMIAAKEAGIHETVINRPGGYHSIIQEGGRNYSGGERQLLEIARVMSGEPTVIILDEATSSLDAKTEETIMKNIRNMGATCIVIAHRLSAIRDCDEIVALDKGAIAERGTHEQLMELGGIYSRLVTME